METYASFGQRYVKEFVDLGCKALIVAAS